MMQVCRDMVCSKCHSLNEHEQITRDDGSSVLMVIRCKECGHEHVQSTLTHWTDPGSPPIKIRVTDWDFAILDFY